MKTLLALALKIGGIKYSVRYVDWDAHEFTAPVFLTPKRIEKLGDHSIAELRLHFTDQLIELIP